MRVFGQAGGGVVNADDDPRLHFAGAGGGVGLLANLPGLAGDEGGARVEEVLAVLHIDDGVGAVGVLVVAGRHVDDEVALVGQIDAGKGAMQAETAVRSGIAGGKQCLGRVGRGVVVGGAFFQRQVFKILYGLSA